MNQNSGRHDAVTFYQFGVMRYSVTKRSRSCLSAAATLPGGTKNTAKEIVMHALRHDILSPSGVEFAVALNLTPSPSTLVNVVTAKSNLLRVYGIHEQPSPIFDHVESERDKSARVRKGTEAVEGEVEMDQSGEGWVNMGAVKVSARHNPSLKNALKRRVSPTRTTSQQIRGASILFVSMHSMELSPDSTKSVQCRPMTTNSTVFLSPLKMQRYTPFSFHGLL